MDGDYTRHAEASFQETRDIAVQAVTFVLIREGRVLLERCPKKTRDLGVGEWFMPGGKLEPGESAENALRRELREEWGLELRNVVPLPIVEGSPVPTTSRGAFLIRPFLVEVVGDPPMHTADGGVRLDWFPVADVLAHSPLPQVRAMVAMARLVADTGAPDRTLLTAAQREQPIGLWECGQCGDDYTGLPQRCPRCGPAVPGAERDDGSEGLASTTLPGKGSSRSGL